MAVISQDLTVCFTQSKPKGFGEKEVPIYSQVWGILAFLKCFVHLCATGSMS